MTSGARGGALLLLLVGAACAPADSASDEAPVQCAAACPDGTSRASYDRVVSGDARVVKSAECETSCLPILPCSYPNVPLISSDASGASTYSCNPIEGYSPVPKDNEVDFGWAAAAHCFDGGKNADETGVDCGGATCGPC